jgi:hypothetical protein
MIAIGSDFLRSTDASLAFTLSRAVMALFSDVRLEGGFEGGATLRFDGGGAGF